MTAYRTAPTSIKRLCTLAALVGLCGCATLGGGGAADSLPDFTLNTVNGDVVHLSDYLGKDVVVLSFWATWCEPCKTELPHLQDIYARHQKQGLMVLAIDMDDPSTVSQVLPFVKRSGFTFPVLLDTQTQVANLYNRQKNAPYTVVISRSGKIVSEGAGYEPGSEKALEKELVSLLAEPKKAS